MSIKEKNIKHQLHPRNRNRGPYDLPALILAKPDLKAYLKSNKQGAASIDFAQPQAVKLLNQAILKKDYGINFWEFPPEHLCPPIPGRADYLHYMADLLGESHAGKIPTGKRITCLDIGTGASAIYPIIGVVEYGWRFLATDIDPASIANVKHTIQQNAILQGKVTCVFQRHQDYIFRGIIRKNEQIDLSICNPPFHPSLEAAQKGSLRKIKNLTGKKTSEPVLNFSGSQHELVYPGGELGFIQKMVTESRLYAQNCRWFSTLVSKQAHLKKVNQFLKKVAPTEIRTIPMGTGNKVTRIVAWTFLDSKE